MASYKYSGTGTICGTAYTKKLRKVDEENGDAEIDVTGGGDTSKLYEAGIDDWKLTVEALGSAPARGTTGSVAVTWGDGSTTSKASCVVVSRKKSGTVGGVVVYTVVVREKEA